MGVTAGLSGGVGDAPLDSGKVLDDVGQGKPRAARESMTLANPARRRKFPALILVTDPVRLPDPRALMERLPRGAGVLLRPYGQPEAEGLARRLAATARRRGLVLLVAGADWRLAAKVGAAGVHLPEAVARGHCLAGLRLWLKRGRLLSIAAHSRAGLARAARLGADAALLSPVFPTASHPGAPTIGATRFALWARDARVPVVALGGIDRRSARTLRFAAGRAAIGAFLG